MADMADEDMNESMEMSAQIWTAFQHMAPYMDKTLKLEQNDAPPKRPRKGEPVPQTHNKPMASNVNLALAMSQLAKLALKLDRDMQLMKKEDTYIFFFGNKGPDSCLSLLMQTTETWAKEHQTQLQGQQKMQMLPLRLKLMQVVFNTLLTKLDQLATAQEGSDLKTRALQTLVLLPDGTCPYLEWDTQAKQLKVSQRKPLTLKHLHQICTDMLEALSDVHLVMRFHALPMTNNRDVTPAKHESRPALATDATALPLSHLADHGGLTEDAQPSAEPDGSPIAEDAGNDPDHAQGSGKREDEVQRQDHEEGGAMTLMPDLANHDMRHLLTHVAFLTLENPGNICFANAAVTSFMWTTLTLDICDFSYWGMQRQQLTSFLLANYATHANLMEQDWFQETMRCWGQQDPAVDSDDITQQDAAEFLHVWLTQIATSAFDMRWERRYMENDSVCTVDSGGKYMPLWMHMDATTANAHSCDLTQLFSLWRQADGMQAALITAPVCLCLHIDRLTRDTTGRIHKSDCMINVDTPCIVPVFQGDGLTHEPVEYLPVALMSHLGQDKGGHYRAGLKLAPTLVDTTTPAEWLLTDDWVQPTPTWRIPPWMLRNTTVIWMVRTDCIRLYRYNLRRPWQDITAEIMPA
jgi:hypothetical protein